VAIAEKICCFLLCFLFLLANFRRFSNWKLAVLPSSSSNRKQPRREEPQFVNYRNRNKTPNPHRKVNGARAISSGKLQQSQSSSRAGRQEAGALRKHAHRWAPLSVITLSCKNSPVVDDKRRQVWW
jgi:hypothetical protein